MHKIIKFLIVGMIGLSVSAVAMAAGESNDWSIFANHFMTKSVSTINNKEELLFVENSHYGSLEPSPHHSGCMLLSLWPVDTDIHYFTDEPVRLSGNITPKNFVSMWGKQNKKNGTPFIPNVNIEGLVTSHHRVKKAYSVSAALGRASYDATHKKIQYLACPLKGGHPLIGYSHMRDLSIFFDQFTIWPPT